jgi:cell division initiation protein
MISPIDIQNKVFTVVKRGYSEDEVNAFLDKITVDLDVLLRDNDILRATIADQSAEIDRYKGSEGVIFDTLETAKALMSDISASAEKRADIVLKNAELDAQRITKEAKESVERLTEEALEMQRRWDQFKIRYKNLLENELERFENLSADLLMRNDSDDMRIFTENQHLGSVKTTTPPSGNLSRTIKTSKRNGL